jgi:hypothetical protein
MATRVFFKCPSIPGCGTRMGCPSAAYLVFLCVFLSLGLMGSTIVVLSDGHISYQPDSGWTPRQYSYVVFPKLPICESHADSNACESTSGLPCNYLCYWDYSTSTCHCESESAHCYEYSFSLGIGVAFIGPGSSFLPLLRGRSSLGAA